jgi:2-dehydro-3-deoxygalactonokinase
MGDVGLSLMARQPSLIVLDWGTSTLRAELLDDEGAVIDSRIEPWGILHTPSGGFGAAFRGVTGEWRAQWSELNTIAAGMIGSANGWVEVPYCAAPAGATELQAALSRLPDTSLHVVPGVVQRGNNADVMRGEETQIVGALDLDPRLAENSVIVLPGTHSKWAHVTDSRISAFTTYMTGELFALLRDHSILGRLAARQESVVAESAAFAHGVEVARKSPRGLAPVLFSARAAVLARDMNADDSLHYLSGLLIGDECCCALDSGAEPDALVGDATLCGHYQRALQLLGASDVPIIDGAARVGLWHLARGAGLIPTTKRRDA